MRSPVRVDPERTSLGSGADGEREKGETQEAAVKTRDEESARRETRKREVDGVGRKYRREHLSPVSFCELRNGSLCLLGLRFCDARDVHVIL